MKQDPNAYVGNEAECRRFVEAILWVSRSGAQWRLLPPEYANWNKCLPAGVKTACGSECWTISRTTRTWKTGWWVVQLSVPIPVRLGHKKSAEQALGRSRGGFSCKIHVTVDGLGNPLRLCLTAGQRHDITQAYHLLEGFEFEHLIADRGYAAEHFIDYLLERGIEAVIPPHPRAKVLREYDEWLDRQRHLGECFINKIKHFRRVFSRFEKLDRSYLGFLHFVSSLIWLR